MKAIADLGIPEQRARVYSDRLHIGDYLVIIEGSNDEIEPAQKVLKECGIEYWGVYNSSGN
ncbi:MAG: hypothetical protein SAK29_28330 [Scytonema sp. PMC 1069.18]|nr:hypothetical protein [Scytonema sp. PMC 1069.18]MEC4883769.1 hypothetical protein [Scytonema sp. PMC 1070.18]